MREADPKGFAARMRERREELGLSQAELAELVGVKQQTIVYYEGGKLKKPKRCATDVAEALQTTREWLLYKEGQRSAGPRLLTPREVVERYKTAPREDKARVSEVLADKQKPRRKSG